MSDFLIMYSLCSLSLLFFLGSMSGRYDFICMYSVSFQRRTFSRYLVYIVCREIAFQAFFPMAVLWAVVFDRYPGVVVVDPSPFCVTESMSFIERLSSWDISSNISLLSVQYLSLTFWTDILTPFPVLASFRHISCLPRVITFETRSNW